MDKPTYLTEIKARSKSQKMINQRHKLAVKNKKLLPRLIEQSKEKFINFMISNETKFANLSKNRILLNLM